MVGCIVRAFWCCGLGGTRLLAPSFVSLGTSLLAPSKASGALLFLEEQRAWRHTYMHYLSVLKNVRREGVRYLAVWCAAAGKTKTTKPVDSSHRGGLHHAHHENEKQSVLNSLP